MNREEAYKLLGLRPLDEFWKEVDGNRGIGGTTWMLVEAALCLLHGEDVILLGRNVAHASDLADTCHDYVVQLSPEEPVHLVSKAGQKMKLWTGATLWWGA